MAIVVPIVTTFEDKGLRAGLRSIQQAEGPVGKLSAAMNVLGPALATAGIAAGAFAVKLGVDGVQAAIAEEAEITKLSKALSNLGFAEQTTAVEAWISAAARATTFSDSDLRPAMAQLAGATGDVTKAQDLLTLAMDVSVGTGKDLDSVTAALAKAYAGNETALKRLIPGLTDADLASDDLFTSTGALADRFSGQATSAAATWEGQLGNVKEAFGELQEAFGAGFLKGLSNAEGGAGDLSTALYDLQEPIAVLGETIGTWLSTLATFAKNVNDIRKNLEDLRKTIEGTPWAKVFDGLAAALNYIANGPLLFIIDQFNRLLDAIHELQNISIPSISLPSIGRSVATTAPTSSLLRTGPTVNVSVNAGMVLDPVSASRTINRILTQGAARQGLTA